MGEGGAGRSGLAAGLVLGGWAAVHSLLATERAKALARARLGGRRAGGLYRLAYNALAVGSFGAVLVYVRRLPDRPLYVIRGAPRALMLAGQAACAAAVLVCAREIGIGRFSGIAQALDLVRGTAVRPTPPVQHPLPRGEGALGWGGPYRVSRHPLNLLFGLGYWLSPVMTRKWAAFGAAGTLYLVLGSLHEERRLRRAYGERFSRYRESVPHLLFSLRGAVEGER